MLYDPKWEIEAPADIKLEPWQEILLKAADIIEEKGWCQRKFFDGTGGVCALGAINLVVGLPPNSRSAINTIPGRYEAYKALKQTLHISHVGIWNDAPVRTKQEVISAMRVAAAVK